MGATSRPGCSCANCVASSSKALDREAAAKTVSSPVSSGAGLVVGYALLARQHRLPRLILAAVAVPLAMSGWLATQAAGPLLPSPDAATFSVIASDKTIDLTGIDTSKVDAVEIKAVASNVEVLLPGPVEDLRTTSRLSDVTVDAWPDDAKPFDVTLIVDATASDVRLVVRQP